MNNLKLKKEKGGSLRKRNQGQRKVEKEVNEQDLSLLEHTTMERERRTMPTHKVQQTNVA